MKIHFEFKTMYEPDENAPPQFEIEHVETLEMESVPRFKDRINFKGKKYFIYDVIYNVVDYRSGGEEQRVTRLEITAVKKVTYPPGLAE